MSARVYLEPTANYNGVRVVLDDGEDVTNACREVRIEPGRVAWVVLYPKNERGTRAPRLDRELDKILTEEIPVSVITGHWQRGQ